MQLTLLSFGVFGLFFGVVAFVNTRRMVQQFSSAAENTEAIAKGSLAREIALPKKKKSAPFFYVLSGLRDSWSQIFRIMEGGISSLDACSGAMSRASDNLTISSKGLYELTNSVSVAAEVMRSNMDDVVAAMEQSNSNVATVAATTEEMTKTMNNIAVTSGKVRSFTKSAVVEAGQASLSVGQLDKAAREINKVTAAIVEISDQTNILALNATIEAARAGEAGNGFAVVAKEIKNLSEQTGKSTKDIKNQIDDIQKTTREAVRVMSSITKTITSVSDLVQDIAAAVEEQAAASEEIATNISQASIGMQEISENISQTSAVNQGVARDIFTVNDITDRITNRCLEVAAYAHEVDSLVQDMKKSVQHIDIDPPLFDIGAVKIAHLNWKIQLEAVLDGRKKMQADQIGDHHFCPFGKWYDTVQGELAASSLFKKIENPHRGVHATAKEIVRLYNQNKPEAAQAKLEQFETSRKELFSLLDELYLSGQTDKG